MTELIVGLHKAHPTGQMRRCGIEFTREKKKIDVSKEDAEIIKNERRLVVYPTMDRVEPIEAVQKTVAPEVVEAQAE